MDIIGAMQYICLGYSFVSFALMVWAGIVAEAPPVDVGHVVIQCFGWPIRFIWWLRGIWANPLSFLHKWNYNNYVKKTGDKEWADENLVGYKHLGLMERVPGRNIDFIDHSMDQLMFKDLPKVNQLDFDIDEVVFYVKDEDVGDIHSDPTAVRTIKGDSIS